MGSLHYVANHPKNITTVWGLLSNFTLVCFWVSSGNEMEFTQGNVCFSQSCIIFNKSNSLPSECKTIVFLDSSVLQLNRELSELRNLSPSFTIFVINYETPLDMNDLNDLSMVFGSANAIAIDHKGHKYILSSSIHRERLFERSEENDLFYKKPKDFRGRSIPVAIFNKQPWVVTRHLGNKTYHYDGIDVNFFNDLSHKYNFSWNHVPLKWCGNVKYFEKWNNISLAGDFGVPLANGSWRCGVGEALDTGVAELTFGNFWFRIRHLDRRDIGPCLTDVYRVYIVRRPEIRQDRWETLHKLLSMSTWLTFALAFAVTTIAYWLASKAMIHLAQDRPLSLFESAFTLFGLVTLAGSAQRRPYTAHIQTWWSLFALLITTAFASTLVTRLTLPVFYPRMDTFNQLVQNGYYVVGNAEYKTGLLAENYVNDTGRPWHHKFIMSSVGVEGWDIQERAERDSKVAFTAARIGVDTVVPFFAATNLNEEMMSKYRLVQEYFDYTFSAIVFRKNSPLFPVLSEGIQQMLEAGLWEHHKREVVLRWASPAKRRLVIEDDRPDFVTPESLTLFKLKPIFFIHLAGLLIASVVFLLELLYVFLIKRKFLPWRE